MRIVVIYSTHHPENKNKNRSRFTNRLENPILFDHYIRKNLNRQVLLTPVADLDGKPIDLFDSIIGDGNATDRRAVAVKKNVAPRILM